MSRYIPYWNWITAVILTITAAWIGATALLIPPSSQPDKAFPRSGFSAPDFTLSTLDGGSAALSDYRGSVVVVNFWASWCPPCRKEMPAIQAAASAYPPKELTILGVNSTAQDNLADVQAFVAEHGLTFPILLDKTGEVSSLYQVRALPTTYFIDQDGVIQKVIYGGPLSEALIRAEIDRLLTGGR